MSPWSWEYATHPAFWGPSTAKTDFCEDNYHVTSYLAECMNTLTNLAYILLALREYLTFRSTADSYLAFLGLATVGFASGAFHGTLKFSAQACDSVSMLIGAAVALSRVWTVDLQAKERRRFNWVLGALVAAASAYFVYDFDIDKHAAAFAVLIGMVCYKSVYLLRTLGLGVDVRKARGNLALRGAVFFVLGYACWQVDMQACTTLRSFRLKVGLPLGVISEFHGWWHVLSAVGVHCYIMLVEQLRLDYKEINGTKGERSR